MLTVENVSFRYDSDPVLNEIDLTVNQGEIVCLLGESGSGKSTLLRVISGLESRYTGNVTVDSQAMENIEIHKRDFGLMFQDFALFPHMSVAQNVAFGLRMQRIPKNEQSRIVDEMLNLVGLAGYQKRDINALSGGQKQRVALARSLAPHPKLLMLDEPLGSLDAGLRERLVLELRQIIQQIGLTAVYVTHDQQEAYAIADRIAVMNKGRIEQYDTAENLYRQPKTAFVAQFLGLSNIVSADFLRKYINLPDNSASYLLHPDSLSLDADGQLEAIVAGRVFQGDRYRLTVKIDEIELSMNINTANNIPNEGQIVHISLNPSAIHPIDL